MIKKTILLSFAVFIFACNNSTPPVSETKTDTVKSETVSQPTNDVADFEFHTLVINIPSPFEIITRLPKAGMSYNKALVNSTDNESKYATSTKKGLNYGSYVIDLVYLSSNEQFSQVKNYFKTSRNLAQSLGCAESFDKIAGSRLDKNIDKTDTINKVIDEIYFEMDGYLRNNDRLLTATQILVGSWVESQWITLSLIKDVSKNPENEILFKKVSEQNFSLEKLVQLLKEYEKEKDFLPIINDLKALQKIYGENNGGEMTQELLNKIFDKLNSARTKIVN